MLDKIFNFRKRRCSRRTAVPCYHQRPAGISVKCAGFQTFFSQPAAQKTAHKSITGAEYIQHFNLKGTCGNRIGGFRRINLAAIRTTFKHDGCRRLLLNGGQTTFQRFRAVRDRLSGANLYFFLCTDDQVQVCKKGLDLLCYFCGSDKTCFSVSGFRQAP